MAGATIRMTAQKQLTLQDIHRKLHEIKGAELISRTESVINGVTIWVLVYEKYYFRAGGYASVSIVLTEYGQEQTACIVSSGGGSGIVNHSYGANRAFAGDCVDALLSCGFAATESDLEDRGKGIVERFFK